jgi:hypothetical protein
MAKAFHELLAISLQNAKKKSKKHIIRSKDLSRIDRERLIKAGCLQRIIRGWYLLCKPYTDPGESTPWYAGYWDFLQQYLETRFGEAYCLSVSTSMELYLGKNYLPAQTIVTVKNGGTSTLALPHNMSLLIYNEQNPPAINSTKYNDLNVVPFEYAICKLPASYYQQHPQEAEIALNMLDNPEKILHFLLKGGMVQSAGRIVGALKHINRQELSEIICQTMLSAGYDIKEENPFITSTLFCYGNRLKSPYSARIEALWATTRNDIIKLFPAPKKTKQNKSTVINSIDSIYVQDAYHSLSIEGYKVTEILIEKIASGQWQPDLNPEDNEQKNAMAAKGYFEAFKVVKKTISNMLSSKSPDKVFQADLPKWYLALFSPSVTAGILPAHQLAGYRNHPVYIRNAQHVPPPESAVRDCMETLFDCISKEEYPAVKAVLTHWLIGFIHPYMDGNGRIARFAMNTFLVTSGYPWTIIPLQCRAQYLSALESASIEKNIEPFTKLILSQM